MSTEQLSAEDLEGPERKRRSRGRLIDLSSIELEESPEPPSRKRKYSPRPTDNARLMWDWLQDSIKNGDGETGAPRKFSVSTEFATRTAAALGVVATRNGYGLSKQIEDNEDGTSTITFQTVPKRVVVRRTVEERNAENAEETTQELTEVTV